MSTPTVDVRELGRVRRIKLHPAFDDHELLRSIVENVTVALSTVIASEDMDVREREQAMKALHSASRGLERLAGIERGIEEA